MSELLALLARAYRVQKMVLAVVCVVGFLLGIGLMNAAIAQDVLGTSFGFPQSSSPIFWPRGMSLESLSPVNLYPNGIQFGLSNTSGGFGTSGTGPISGVGLVERTVSPLVQREMERAYLDLHQLIDLLSDEEVRSQTWLELPILGHFRLEMQSISAASKQPGSAVVVAIPYSRTAVDAVLNDGPDSVDSILNRSF